MYKEKTTSLTQAWPCLSHVTGLINADLLNNMYFHIQFTGNLLCATLKNILTVQWYKVINTKPTFVLFVSGHRVLQVLSEGIEWFSMDLSDSDFSDSDEVLDHKKLPQPPDKVHVLKEEEGLLKKESLLAPNHMELVRAGSSLGSISLPPKHLQLSPNHQELIWIGSSLGTMHKLPLKTKQNTFKGSQISGIQRVPSTLSKMSKLSNCMFGSQTVSESGTDNYSFCRICQMQGDDRDPLFSPCRCSGSLRYVHGSCLKVSGWP